MVNLETKKYHLISQIMAFNNERIISEVENFINNLALQFYYTDLFKPMQEDLNIAQMIQEQHYQTIDKQGFDKIINDLDIQEPFLELINKL